MPGGRGRGWSFPRHWIGGHRRGVSPGPVGPVPVLIVSAPSWHSTAPATGTSVIILPAIQGSAASVVDDAADTGPSQTVDLSSSPQSSSSDSIGPGPEPEPQPDGPTQPLPPPAQPACPETLDTTSLAAPAPTDSGRGSRLSVITVSAPVQCVCAFVAARARRHCAECRRRRCDFAASKTVGYCGLPTLVVAWGAFWVLIILALGGVLNVSAPTGG
ncbi:endo-1,3(4)-beta-glucanase ARB_04519-like isoform X1 [Amphibalanus amphitrite]|uniref:endo-1,3(4)-beta-glucanase ARB_04519-like isoform X1 n=1 Tax=Amphibalanus amphitrite TaxID=1232801 RepID=UPI001C927D6B|nr:endo-1,3(4)-beta-glucanase ARB_04519-like isoform X1 [Amphibalanus amphitrite]